GPAELAQVLRHVPVATDPPILVDASGRDDAAVFQMAPDRAIVATVDFFTPLVDDPYDFGRIAATNAFSDVYAMGATPLLALNLVGWPREGLPFELLGEVLRGGAEVARAAGAFVLGGHSVDDPEPKYGMVAIGEVHPCRHRRHGLWVAGPPAHAARGERRRGRAHRRGGAAVAARPRGSRAGRDPRGHDTQCRGRRRRRHVRGRRGRHDPAVARGRADVGGTIDRRGPGAGRRARGRARARGHARGGGDRPSRRRRGGPDRGAMMRRPRTGTIPEYTRLTPDALDALERAWRERRRVALRRRGTEYVVVAER